MEEPTGGTPRTRRLYSDDPEVIRQAQERILAALNKAGDVTCAACNGLLMRCYSPFGGWLWMAVYGQDGVPAAQCPEVPGLYDIGHGAHRPKSSSEEIPFKTGDLP